MKAIFRLIIISVLLFFGCGGHTNYDTFATAKSNPWDEFHIAGNFSREGIEDKDSIYFSFYMKDKVGNESKVIFNGIKPERFPCSELIVVTGKMKLDVFHASKLLVKCPNY